MGLRGILSTIEDERRARRQAIEARSDREIDALWEEATRQAENAFDEERSRATNRASSQIAPILHEAQLDALRCARRVEQELAVEMRVMLIQRLENIRTSPDYPDLLDRLAVEAMLLLRPSLEDRERSVILADERDRALLERILSRHDFPQTRIEGGYQGWGGVIARSADGLVEVDNTLETRLANMNPVILALVAERLNEDGDESRL